MIKLRTPTKPRITPDSTVLGTFKTDTLIGVTKEDIVQILGFEPNVQDDTDKVVNSWAFRINDLPSAIVTGKQIGRAHV